MEYKDKVIVNLASVGSWHTDGQNRLLESLVDNKEEVELNLLIARSSEPELRTWYETKLNGIKVAASHGFRFILWLDCSITLIPGKSLDPIFEYTKKHGVYLYPSGYKSGQTANLQALDFYGTTTDEQMEVPEVASNVVCIDLESEVGNKFFQYWTNSLNSDANLGEKWPSEVEAIIENPDPRFLHSRQDQSTCSLAAWRAAAPIDMDSLFVYREGETLQKETSIFKLKGGK